MTKNKTIVKPLSNHMFVYTKQPTTKNTKPGDIVLYKKDLWLNDGNNVIPMSLTKNYVDEKVEEALKENTMENYIVINGKRAELTEEQLNSLCMFNRFAQMAKEQFGLTITPKETAGKTFKTLFGVDFSDCSERTNPFNSEPEKVNDSFYYITSDGVRLDDDDDYNAEMIATANSFNDKDFVNQIYLHELFNRKLLKYAYDNNAEDHEWNSNNNNCHYYIYFNYQFNEFIVTSATRCKNYFCTYFSSEKVARQAIEDVVKPFMKEHPKFVW